ncbi:MAG TPA: ABC transporter substrate-binding protein [Spirochaetales bacterium]|nr:ABC transporter substrate-binding protein [Spirochaetales bacterium]
MLKKTLLAVAVLATVFASASFAATPKSKDYVYVFTTDIRTFNYLNDQRQTNSMHLTNFVDALVEHDKYGIIRPSLAESWSANADYTVWTFNIRKGVKWMTGDLEPYAEVKAQDWVDSLHYMLDNKSTLNYLVRGFVKNADEYASGKITDFNQVGVKAKSDYVLEYTLEKPTPYFDTMLTYTAYWPVNGEFLKSKGKDFGKVDKNGILYNGAYVLSNYTSKSVIEYDTNPTYWDKAHVYIQHVKLVYFDGKDPDSLFNNFDAGVYVAAPVYTDNEALFARAQSKYKDYLFRSRQDATTFVYAFNYDRNSFASPADPTKGKTPKNEAQIADTKKAVLNRNFRKAIFFGIDRPTILAQRNGAINKLSAIRNTYTAPELSADKAGKDYTKYVEDALKARNPADFTASFKVDDAQDPYYNPTKAKAYMAKAKAELTAKGVRFPVQLDIATDVSYTKGLKMDQSLKAGLESLFGPDTIRVNVVEMDEDNYNASTYFAETGSQSNYDIGNTTGWGPDYGDPYTFLQTLEPVVGALLTPIGLDPVDSGSDKAAATAIGLYDYAKKVEAANEEYKDTNKRFKMFAEAEAQILDDAIVLPYMSFGGAFAVTREVPYSRARAAYGTDEDKYKGVIIGDKVVSLAERDKARAQWEKERTAEYKKLNAKK